MDVLTGKSKKDYTYVSRYASLPYYYNSNDKRYVYGLSKHLRQDTEYVLHHIADTDTLDSLALKYYGRPDLYWVIADFNRITDPFISLSETFIDICVPSLNGIRWE